MGRSIIFTVKDIATVIRKRQENEFDARFAVTGDTGDGKSTLLSKIFYKIGKFNPWKHQAYDQEEIIKLLTTQVKGKCFDDEAINTGYKRNWQDKGQQKQIKILTNYRDSLNVYGSALPNFFSLDKDLRDLFFLMIHVIERGVAVVHLPLQGRMYGQDKWDAKNNARIEENWTRKIKKDPNFKIPYWQLSTFAGYLYFTKLTPKQEKLYKEVKHAKRARVYEQEDKPQHDFYEETYKLLLEGKLTSEGLLQICLMNDRKYLSVLSQLNGMLKNRGVGKTASELWKDSKKSNSNKSNDQITDLVPTFSQ